MHEDIAGFCVKKLENLGASYAEARAESESENNFVMKNGNLELSSFARPVGVGARFLINKKMGFFSSNKFDKGLLLKIIKSAVANTKRLGGISESIILTPESIHIKKYAVPQKKKLQDTSPEEKIGLLAEADRMVLSTGIDVKNRFMAYSDSIKHKTLSTSEGTEITSVIPRLGMHYVITVSYGRKASQRHWSYGSSGGWERAIAWNIPEVLVHEVKAQKNVLAKGVKPLKGVMDFVVGPQVTGIMAHESVGHPYEADRILGREAAQAGESFVTSKMLGTQIGSSAASVADDPTIANSYGFYLYDDEGVKAKRKNLMSNGMITDFLHNRETAAKMKLESSNGSSRAAYYNRESIVRMSNTFVLPGKWSEEELIEGVKQGVYMKNFNEWNIDDKRLNQKYVGAEAFMIKNGRIGKPLINPAIEVSTPELWKSVDAVGNNLEHHAGNCGKGEPMQAIPVWLGGPSMRLKGLRVR